jgi:hypothetical protein
VSALGTLDPIGLSNSKFVSFCYACGLEEGGKVSAAQYLSMAIQQARSRRAMTVHVCCLCMDIELFRRAVPWPRPQG